MLYLLTNRGCCRLFKGCRKPSNLDGLTGEFLGVKPKKYAIVEDAVFFE